jgi:hypothetical protein
MKTIKHLKKDFVQLGNLIYKPYKVCDLPNNFGFNYDKENDKEGIGQWFNYRGYTLGIYTDEQIDAMTWAECEEILNQKK